MSRFTRTQIPEAAPLQIQNAQGETVPAPPPVVPTLVTRLDPTRNEHTDTGPTTTIDAQPDFRFPLLAWMYSISHEIQNPAYASHPLASPASVLAYTQIMFTALLFHADTYLRPGFSRISLEIQRNAPALDFFATLLDMAVPSFATNEFEALRPHQDDLAQNLTFFGTLAGSHPIIDFGRLIPAFTFIRLHNLLATLPANSAYATLVREFYISDIAQFAISTTHNVMIRPSQLFGRFATYGTPATVSQNRNWFNDAIDDFITTNSIRVVNATATVTRIPLFTPPDIAADPLLFNPYLFLTGFQDANVTQLTRFVRNMNDFIMHTFPTSRPLRNYAQPGNQEIVRHLVFNSAIPTWHTFASLGSADITDAIITGPSNTRLQFGEAIRFLAARTAPADDAARPSLIVRRPAAIAAPNAANAIFSAIMPAADPRPADAAGIRTLSAANVAFYDTPECLIFDPSSPETAHHVSVITSGKLIELNDISAIGIPTPFPAHALGNQNADYILGSIPMSLVSPPTSQTATHVRRRNWNLAARQAQIVFRGLASRVIIPKFSQGRIRLVSAVTQASDADIANAFPGAHVHDNLQHAQDGLNVFSYPLGSPTDSPVAPAPFSFWSSYRYYDDETATWYMLPSLRHIYGTRSRLSASSHPARRIM